MDALRMRRKLHDLALEALLFDRALVPSDLAPVNVRALPLGLQKLAARYAGKQSLTVDAVLSQLFVSDVVEYLLSLPSCYWSIAGTANLPVGMQPQPFRPWRWGCWRCFARSVL